MSRDILTGRTIVGVEYEWYFDTTLLRQRKYVSAVILDNGIRLKLNHVGEVRS